MAGTKIGGLKAARVNLERYGNDFYVRIGTKGGQQKPCRPRGFAANPALARVAGAKGGRISSRKGVKNGDGKKWNRHKNTYKIIEDGKVITKINVKYISTN